MVNESTLIHDFEFLDKELINLQHESEKILRIAQKVSPLDKRRFIEALRDQYAAKDELIRDASRLTRRTKVLGFKEIKSEEEFEDVIRKIISKRAFDATELVKSLYSSFEFLRNSLTFSISYHTSQTKGYTILQQQIGRRVKAFKVLAELFSRASGSSTVFPLLHERLNTLATKRYVDFYNALDQLDKLFVEYNKEFAAIMELTNQLNMVQGMNMQKKTGLFSALFGKKEEQVPLTSGLTGGDILKIQRIQTVVHKFIEGIVPRLQNQRDRVKLEIKQIADDESYVQTMIKKSFRGTISLTYVDHGELMQRAA